MRDLLRGIYAIVDAAEGDPEDQLAAVLAGGVRLIQYRAKAGVDRAVLRRLHARTRAAGGRLIVNDALEAIGDCDGVHLGQEDLALIDGAALRARYPAAIIGVSCPDPGTARAAQALGADYAGVGAVYPTGSKADAGEPIGPDGLRAVVRAVELPVVAIGGISRLRIPEVRATGAAMAAVISAISRAADPARAARELVEAWRG